MANKSYTYALEGVAQEMWANPDMDGKLPSVPLLDVGAGIVDEAVASLTGGMVPRLHVHPDERQPRLPAQTARQRHGRVSRQRVVGTVRTGRSWYGGGLNGLYQVFSVMTRGLRERATAAVRMPPAVRTLLQCVVTFHLILVTWVFFRATSLADAVTVLSRIAESLVGLPTLLWVRLATGDVLLSVALIAVLVGVEALDERRPFWERLAVRPRYVRWGVYYALLIGLIVFGTWELQQFVYMQFYEVDRL